MTTADGPSAGGACANEQQADATTSNKEVILQKLIDSLKSCPQRVEMINLIVDQLFDDNERLWNKCTGFNDNIRDITSVVIYFTKKVLECQEQVDLTEAVCKYWIKFGDVLEMLVEDYNLTTEFDESKADWWWHNVTQSFAQRLLPVVSTQPKTAKASLLLSKGIPKMFATFLWLETKLYGLVNSSWLIKLLFDLIKSRHDEAKPIDSEEWQKLIDDLSIKTKYLRYLTVNQEKSDEQLLCQATMDLFDDCISTTLNKKQTEFAQQSLNELIFQQKTTPKALFKKFELEINTYICEIVLIKLSNGSFTSEFFFDCFAVFGIDLLNSEFFRYLIPMIVVDCDEAAQNFAIKEFTSDLDIKSITDFFSAFNPEIFCYLFFESKNYPNGVDAATKKIKDTLMTIRRICNINTPEELKQKIQSNPIRNAFLTHISKHHYRVLQALSFLASYQDDDGSMRNITLNKFQNEEELRQHLRPTILSFFHRMDDYLTKYAVKIEDKLMGINSFNYLITLMGSDCITALRVKLIQTLITLTGPDFYGYPNLIRASCEGWKILIRIVDQNQLKNQMSSIAASILPLLGFYPDEAAGILKELIFTDFNHGKLRFTDPEDQKKFYGQLYFLPEAPQLDALNKALAPFTTDNPATWKNTFNIPLNNLDHINPLVKEVSLRRLIELLGPEKYQPSVYELCNWKTKGENFDSFVSELVAKMMSSFNNSNSTILLLIADCFGQLGAIDPSRVDQDKPIITKERDCELFFSYSDDQFKIKLIQALIRSVNSNDCVTTQNCSFYALQQILKLYQVDQSLPLFAEGRKIWESLDLDSRQFCNVLKTSQYMMKESIWQKDKEQTPAIIFGSTPDLSFNDWIQNWASQLVKRTVKRSKQVMDLDSPNIELSQGFMSQGQDSQEFRKFLEILTDTFKKEMIPTKIIIDTALITSRDFSVAQFLLPFIVITSLRDADKPERNSIIAEIKAIINKNSSASHQTANLCAQTIFHLYDFLKVWLKKRQRQLNEIAKNSRHREAVYKKDKEYQGVAFLLNKISCLELSNLAFECKANSRALRYLELYLNEHKENAQGIFEEEITSFLKIFVALDEMDFVDGCNAKRLNKPTIEETILMHEATGEVQEALNCCGKAIEQNKDNFELREKYLTLSMAGLNQVDQVYNYGLNLMNSHLQWQTKTAPFVIEAAWKLGSWDDLDLMLEKYGSICKPSIGVGIGNLLSVIRSRKFDDFDSHLNQVRQHEVGPLAASAMEIRGYVRGHQSIISMHILSDIHMAVKYLYNVRSADDDDDEVMIEADPTNERNKLMLLTRLWDERLSFVRKLIQSQEPILNAHRALLSVIKNHFDDLEPQINKEIFKTWLKSLRLSRKSGYFQRAYTCYHSMCIAYRNLDSTSLDPSELAFMITEEAKIFWLRGQSNEAIKKLNNNLKNYFQELGEEIEKNLREKIDKRSLDVSRRSSASTSMMATLSLDTQATEITQANNEQMKHAFAKIQLLLAKYSDEVCLTSEKEIIDMYKKVTEARPDWEEGHYCLGMYYDKLLKTFEGINEQNSSGCTQIRVKVKEMMEIKKLLVKSLAKSLEYGVKHVYTSLPRLLTVWFDLGTELEKQNKTTSNRRKSSLPDNDKEYDLKKLREAVEELTDKNISPLLLYSPVYIMFVAFDLIQGRLLHPCSKIVQMLKEILIQLILEYPQQAIWRLMRSYNSSNRQRSKVLKDIVNKVKVRDKSNNLKLTPIIIDMLNFVEQLKDFCIVKENSQLRNRLLSMQKVYPKLYGMINQKTCKPILMPIQAMVSATMPNGTFSPNHKPFSSRLVYIEKFDDKVEVLNSLQKPKKIKIRGSDGKSYVLLCKSTDDLRKDGSLIEFNNMLNRFFTRDPEARRRQLRMRTYQVIPLADDCGLIEWVFGLKPYKAIIEEQYRLCNNLTTLKDIHKVYPMGTMSGPAKVAQYKSQVLPKYDPPVFSQWFIENYSDPLSWFLARLSYIRTTAVFSMTGYLFGLGDRHGENILIEEETGETVHVDFNCLFNKGETFQVPEIVPFRLTHNMIDAMGPTGLEGPFRKACEHTLRVVRLNKEALLNSMINSFRYDHLFEWYTGSERVNFMHHMINECINLKADQAIVNIEARIDGKTRRNKQSGNHTGHNFAISGQVDHVIREAIDVEKLALMYIGWAPYL